VTFTVTNTGTQYSDTYYLSLNCASVTCTSNPPTSVTLSPGHWTSVTVNFNHPTSLLTGSISLHAADSSNSCPLAPLQAPGPNAGDQAEYVYTSSCYESSGTWGIVALAGPAPMVSLAPYSPGYYPASDGVTFQFSTPVLSTMNTDRSLTLAYNSATAHPVAIVTMDVSNRPGGPYPSLYRISVQRNGANLHLMNGSDTVYYDAGTTSSSTIVVAIDAQANGLTTNAYPVTILVTAIYSQGDVTTTTASRILVNDQSGSAFGAGFGLAGVPQLYGVTGSYGMLLVDGSGSVAYFDRACSGCSFVSPAGVWGQLAVNGSNYRLTALDGSFYDFNSSGQVLDHYPLPTVEDQVFHWSGTQLDSVNDPSGREITLLYSGGFLDETEDRYSRFVVFGFSSGQLKAVSDPNDLQWDSLSYGANNLMTSVKDASGGVNTFVYNALDQEQVDSGPADSDFTGALRRPTVTTTTNSLVAWQPGRAGTYAQPKYSLRPDTVLASVIGPLGDTTRVAQDRFGLPTLDIDALHDTTTISRDTLGNSLVVTAPNGHKIVATYRGYLLTAQNDSLAGQFLSYSYDSTTGGRRLATVQGGSSTLSYTYYPSNDVGPEGTLRYEYAGGDSVAHHFPDAYGRDTLVVDGLGHRTRWRFGSLTYGSTLDTAIDADGNRTAYTHGSFGLVQTITSSTQGTDSITYDNVGRPIRNVDPMNGVTQYAYSPLGVTHVTDARGGVYKFDINAWGLVTTRHDLADTTKADSTWYDVGGNPRIVKTRADTTITMSYDALGRLVSLSAPRVSTDSFYYCPRGACFEAINGNGWDSLTYDLLGRVTSVVQQMPNGSTRDTLLYTYDTQGRRIKRQLGHASPLDTATWHYDPTFGVVNKLCGVGTCASISRDFELKPDSITYRPGLAGSWWYKQSYNARHLPVQSAYSLYPLDTVAALTLGYDSVGHVDTIGSYEVNGPKFYTKHLTYDRLGRVTRDCEYIDPNCSEEAQHFAYDAAGNDTLWGHVTAGNRYSSFQGWSLTYDSRGNVTRKAGGADTTWYTWDLLGQLTAVRRDSAGAQVVMDSLQYDALGHRVAQTLNGVTTWYLYDGDQVLQDINPTGAMEAEYAFDGSNLFAVRTPTDTLVALRSPVNGTVLGLARANGGAVVQRNNLDPLLTPFGEQEPTDSGFVLRYQMGSQEYDQATGLYHLGVRYYDPQLHRFLSEDPAGVAAGLNLYAYADNDPIDFTDPSGRETCYGPVLVPESNTNWDTGETIFFYVWGWGFYDCAGGGGGAGPSGGSAQGGGAGGGGGSQPGNPHENRVQCAAAFADRYSIAAGLHALGVGNDGGVWGFLTEALGGNAVRGAIHFFTNHPSSGSELAQDWGQAAAAGPFLGLNPLASGLARGPASQVMDKAMEIGWNGVTGAPEAADLAALAPSVAEAAPAITAADVATGIGALKVAYDAISFIAGWVECGH